MIASSYAVHWIGERVICVINSVLLVFCEGPECRPKIATPTQRLQQRIARNPRRLLCMMLQEEERRHAAIIARLIRGPLLHCSEYPTRIYKYGWVYKGQRFFVKTYVRLTNCARRNFENRMENLKNALNVKLVAQNSQTHFKRMSKAQ